MARKRLDSSQTLDMIDSARRQPEEIRRSIDNKAFGVLGLKENATLVSAVNLWPLGYIYSLLRLTLAGILRCIFKNRNGQRSRPCFGRTDDHLQDKI